MGEIQAAVCDDEPVFRSHIRELLAADSIKNGYDLCVKEYADGSELLSSFEKGQTMDILFLDIRMKQKDGMETARILREKGCNCLIIFLTSLSEYMQKGYEVKAFRYLLKEQADSELEGVMRECRRELASDGFFVFSCEHKNYSVRKTDILYLESSKRLILLHTMGEVFRFYQKLDNLEKELAQDGFLRCHRSFLVRESCVKGWKEDELWLENGERIPISRSYEKEVNRRLMLRIG
ncbi:MAG: LytTR family DNA-binding domain-containing protein [Candidatus Gastranaerophilales bacterium]|nr:LytTR family DNA-binding domain-containing protein [Candidatus Gastranaerophilales bacterium]